MNARFKEGLRIGLAAVAEAEEQLLKDMSERGACFAGCDRCEFNGSPDFETMTELSKRGIK